MVLLFAACLLSLVACNFYRRGYKGIAFSEWQDKKRYNVEREFQLVLVCVNGKVFFFYYFNYLIINKIAGG